MELKVLLDSARVEIQKMRSQKFEGWRIRLDRASCGFVKFFPKTDHTFQEHVTVDFKISISQRGRHIGRIALRKAIAASTAAIFVAHVSKKNIASRKALEAVGFLKVTYPESRQLCMVFQKPISRHLESGSCTPFTWVYRFYGAIVFDLQATSLERVTARLWKWFGSILNNKILQESK